MKLENLKDEQKFMEWYSLWAKIIGLDPDPDNPLHYYDYRKAYKSGVNPEISKEDGFYHWPSEFKHDDHPNRFVDGWDTKYNIPEHKWNLGKSYHFE